MSKKHHYSEVIHKIADPKAPERLRGLRIKIVLCEKTHSLTFEAEVPDELTKQENGYLSWSIGEYVDSLREKFPWISYNKTESSRPA